jgi:exonuclease SbcD
MIVELKNPDGSPAALVGALPYLHERDLVTVEGGQGVSERETALRNAMLACYRKMADALQTRAPGLPHIVTGHLFAVDNGEKNDTWTGTLMSVDTAEFPDSIDYLALGHLHDADTLKTLHNSVIRYPGAPLAVSFRELEVPKSVTVIDTENIKNIREIPLPAFQDMRQLKGNRQELEEMLSRLSEEADHSVWCSVENTGEYEPGLLANLSALV